MNLVYVKLMQKASLLMLPIRDIRLSNRENTILRNPIPYISLLPFSRSFHSHTHIGNINRITTTSTKTPDLCVQIRNTLQKLHTKPLIKTIITYSNRSLKTKASPTIIPLCVTVTSPTMNMLKGAPRHRHKTFQYTPINVF